MGVDVDDCVWLFLSSFQGCSFPADSLGSHLQGDFSLWYDRARVRHLITLRWGEAIVCRVTTPFHPWSPMFGCLGLRAALIKLAHSRQIPVKRGRSHFYYYSALQSLAQERKREWYALFALFPSDFPFWLRLDGQSGPPSRHQIITSRPVHVHYTHISIASLSLRAGLSSKIYLFGIKDWDGNDDSQSQEMKMIMQAIRTPPCTSLNVRRVCIVIRNARIMAGVENLRQGSTWRAERPVTGRTHHGHVRRGQGGLKFTDAKKTRPGERASKSEEGYYLWHFDQELELIESAGDLLISIVTSATSTTPVS